MQMVFASVITVLVFVCFITEVVPVPVAAVCGAILMGVFHVADFTVVFSGFSNDVTLIIIGTSIVGAALFEVKVVHSIGNLLKKNVAKDEKTFLVSLIVLSAVLSAFLSNIAVTAMFIPIIASVEASSDKAISRKHILMFLGISSGVGGLCTLIGSPPQLLANGMMKNAGFEGFTFIELAKIGVPLLVLLIVYAVTIGYKSIKKCDGSTQTELSETQSKDESDGIVPRSKQVIAIVILVLMITGFCAQVWTIGTVAMASGMLMIVTGCISLKKVFEKVDWGSAMTIAGSLGFASALEKSGICQVIAQKSVAMLGADSGIVVYSLLLLLLCFLLTNIISNVACTTLFVPIAINLAALTGYNVKVLVLAVVIGTSLSWATPIASPPMVMVMDQGGYKFTDYMKVGGLFCILSCILAIPILLFLN